MNGASDGTEPTLKPPDNLLYGALHTAALIYALKFPLHFYHARPRIYWKRTHTRGHNLSSHAQPGCDARHTRGQEIGRSNYKEDVGTGS